MSANEVQIDKLRALYECVQTRPRPEDVAELVLEVIGQDLSHARFRIVEKAAKHSMRRNANTYSSMADDFARPTTKIENQVKATAALFGVEPLSAADCIKPTKVEAYVRQISAVIHKTYGSNSRLSKGERRDLGIFKCQRWYNKRFRILVRMERKIEKLIWNQRKYEFTRVGKSALAVQISFEDFVADIPTACVVAYLTARMSLRSTFTDQSQERAFDEVAQALLDHAKEKGSVRWDVLAMVLPDVTVLKHLTDEQKGRMLGTWWLLLVDMADMLQQVYGDTGFNRKTMIVSRGNDSSTWNQVAGGWNKAREHWISLVHAMGMEAMLDELCPGKVMRLMAADVVRWHSHSKGSVEDAVHPDTKVWADLPTPWDVVHGREQCSADLIEQVCHRHNVPAKNWIGRKQDREPVPFKPTPELVHGVTVSSPALARALRKAGVFSGQGITDEFPAISVQRDKDGFALRAEGRGV